MLSAKQIQSLNETELEVYKYISKNPKKVQQMKIRDVAEAAHVSTTTVLRFCKKVGCDGYAEFKIKYRMELEKNEDIVDHNETRYLYEYFKRVDTDDFDEQLDEIAQVITSKPKLIFMGIGTSGALCKYAARYFSNIGKFSQHIDDPFYPVPADFSEDSVIFVLSVSGETKETIDQINKFRKESTTIISLTNTKTNTIAHMSDYNLNYYLPELVVGDVLNLTTQVPVVYMLESIAKKVYSYSKD